MTLLPAPRNDSNGGYARLVRWNVRLVWWNCELQGIVKMYLSSEMGTVYFNYGDMALIHGQADGLTTSNSEKAMKMSL
jgi:hypothetical protein